MVQYSAELNALAGALAKAQAEMEGAKKEGLNPHFRSRYADLASVWDACREALTKNGLSVVQTLASTNDETGVVVHITTMLLHESGQYITDTLSIKPKENSPQGVGSTVTYGRRYALAAIAGVAPEDDDGNAATGRSAERGAGTDVKAKFQAQVPGKIVTPATAGN